MRQMLARPVHAFLARTFGPPPFDPAAHPGDPGLFGPGSATWRIIGDQASIVGGVRSLLVQVQHPLAVAGVADHSGYRSDPIGRLQRTSAYVVGTAFGAMPEVVETARRVRHVHERVVGIAPDGRRYDAGDPHLLAWVSIALTSSFLAAHRAYGRFTLDEAAADAFVEEQSRAAALLDPRVDLDRVVRASDREWPMIEEGRLPRSVAELERLLGDYRPELRLDEQGRDALRFLLWPDLDPIRKSAYLSLLAGAVATLGREERRLLRIPSPPVAGMAARTQARALITVLRLTSGPSPSVSAASRRVSLAARRDHDGVVLDVDGDGSAVTDAAVEHRDR
jgi:uncharacterized protein (DUF2236 family)